MKVRKLIVCLFECQEVCVYKEKTLFFYFIFGIPILKLSLKLTTHTSFLSFLCSPS